jgi:hypothetical protein
VKCWRDGIYRRPKNASRVELTSDKQLCFGYAYFVRELQAVDFAPVYLCNILHINEVKASTLGLSNSFVMWSFLMALIRRLDVLDNKTNNKANIKTSMSQIQRIPTN